MILKSTLFGLVGPILLAKMIKAQATTNATCLAGTEWMRNSLGQSPCLVAAYLSAQCNNGQWMVPALVSQGPYNVPKDAGANTCRCNSVAYSLLSACSVCQGGLVGTWPAWIGFCPSSFVNVGKYPNNPPAETNIPNWALIDPSITNTWNATEANLIATSETKPSGSKSNTGAIAGGVVGGIAGLSLIGALIWLWVRRRRSKGEKVTPVPYGDPGFSTDYQAEKVPPRTDMGTPAPGYLMSGMGTPGPMKPYDPSDPSTFPTSPAPSSIPNTTYDSHMGVGSPTPLMHGFNAGGSTAYSGTPPPTAGFHPYPPQNPPARPTGQYTGAAEI